MEADVAKECEVLHGVMECDTMHGTMEYEVMHGALSVKNTISGTYLESHSTEETGPEMPIYAHIGECRKELETDKEN